MLAFPLAVSRILAKLVGLAARKGAYLTERVRVFLACSFAAEDNGLVGSLVHALSAKRFNLELRTAHAPQARGIGDKISDLVDWADVTIGLFSKRYQDPETREWLPPPYVVSECSYALGRYSGDESKGVYGVVEDGIKHFNLGLPTAAGAEFPSFLTAEIAEKLSPRLENYFLDLSRRYGRSRSSSPQAYIRQRAVQKTVEIYRTGCGVFKNTVELMVGNPEQIVQHGNRVQHNIWLPGTLGRFPALATMTATPTRERTVSPVFSSVFIRRNGREIPQPMRVEAVVEEERLMTLQLEFPFKVKHNDLLTYQFMWSMPGVFHTFEDDLPTESSYEQVTLRVPFGKIGAARLRLKFERETLQGASPPLFSKEPFVQFGIADTEHGLLLEPHPVSSLFADATWETYECSSDNLLSAMIMKWRPVSRATLSQAIQQSRFVAVAGQPSTLVASRSKPRLASRRPRSQDGR